MTDTAHDLLAAYGQIAGLAPLSFDGHGCARLLFEDAVAVDLEIDEPAGCIQVYSVLGPVPAGGREPLYRSLLEGNLFGQHTGGAVLAVDPVREEVLLSARVDPAAVTAATLASWMDGFAGTAADWQRRFAAGELSQAADHGIGAERASPVQWPSHFVPG